jgi:hypothetical protein
MEKKIIEKKEEMKRNMEQIEHKMDENKNDMKNKMD